ncbi:MAG TPA: hypothetical protein VG317_16055 [Pseudonocardiaceae bacterium]|jgi:hypothetical protein|nr:hypothetical protein [Pseudonocardiaceae bacterium]
MSIHVDTAIPDTPTIPDTRSDYRTDTRTQAQDRSSDRLPTVPCSVVWSGGHAYVLESVRGKARWVGVDDRGRPQELSGAELCRRGWTHPRS